MRTRLRCDARTPLSFPPSTTCSSATRARRLRSEGKIKIGAFDTLLVDLESLGLPPGSYSTGGVGEGAPGPGGAKTPSAEPTGAARAEK